MSNMINMLIDPLQLPQDFLKKTGYRYADSFLCHVNCLLPYGQLDVALTWCRAECSSEWRWKMKESASDIKSGHYEFYFDSELDAVAFSLRWS